MGQGLNSWVVAAFRPPLLVLRFTFRIIHRLFFAWWLDDLLVKKNNRQLAQDIRENLSLSARHYSSPSLGGTGDFGLLTNPFGMVKLAKNLYFTHQLRKTLAKSGVYTVIIP